MPERLAQYKVLRERGQGGMGVVYEAFDERLERKVALKLIKTGVLDPTMRTRFWREARTAAAISHPNVCQVFDVGDAEGVMFLAMERQPRVRRRPAARGGATPAGASDIHEGRRAAVPELETDRAAG
jgi:hypothetical protein